MLGVFTLVMVVLVWALVAGRLAKLSITTALAVVIVGMALTAGSNLVIRINLDTKIVERGVELTLAILLFADATVVRSSILRRERRVLTRLLVIGLPLSLIIAWLVGFALFPPREAWLLAVLALTVVRIIPVFLALRGTTITRLEAIFIGWMGPRGLASLVFGLLAGVALNGSASLLVAQVTVITVLLSVILHGLTAGPIGAAFAKRSGRARGRDERAGSRDLNGRRGEVAGALRQLRATTGPPRSAQQQPGGNWTLQWTEAV